VIGSCREIREAGMKKPKWTKEYRQAYNRRTRKKYRKAYDSSPYKEVGIKNVTKAMRGKG